MELAGAAHEGVVGAVFFPEGGVFFCAVEAGFKLGKTVHKRFRYVLAAEFSKAGGDSYVASVDIECLDLVC